MSGILINYMNVEIFLDPGLDIIYIYLQCQVVYHHIYIIIINILNIIENYFSKLEIRKNDNEIKRKNF